MIKRLVKLGISLAVRAWDMALDRGRSLLGRPAPARAVILYYHAIRPDQRSRFARQMEVLSRDFRVFGAHEPNSRPSNGTARHVAVTFDDAFVSVIEQALPELDRHRIPFIVFVPTGSLGKRPAWIRSEAHPSWRERVADATQLKALAGNPLVTLGSHSVSHPNFPRLSPTEAAAEFRESKATLEAIVGRPVDLFSFPHGARNAALDQSARDAGYRHVYTITPERITLGSAGFSLGRVLTDPDDWLLEFRLKSAGAYRWQHSLRRA